MSDFYRDPKRKIGSQSESPSIKYENENIIVKGYQIFTIDKITRRITYKGKKEKFKYIEKIFNELNKNNNCKSIVDIGCSSGLSSLIALNSNFDNIVSLDHDPEYIKILKKIKESCNITKINEFLYKFGDNLNDKFDVVFCGAIIHWIFSLTADFRKFDKIISYLDSISNNFLIIEWVDPMDRAIKSLNHIKKRGKIDDEEYCTENFEKSIKKFTTIVSKEAIDGKHRIIYILKKNEKNNS